MHLPLPPRPLPVNDARCIIDFLQETPRIRTLRIYYYLLHDDAVLNAFRNGLPLCTSITTIALDKVDLRNEELELFLPAFSNTSITTLRLIGNNIQGQRGGHAIRDLLVGNKTLRELELRQNVRFGPEGRACCGLGQGFAGNEWLQKLDLYSCKIGNQGLANWILSMGDNESMINKSLTDLNLSWNGIESDEGGRQVSLLLQRCFRILKVLKLAGNSLGPLGASALAPGLAAASQLEELDLSYCRLGNEGVANLMMIHPDNDNGRRGRREVILRSLTELDIHANHIEGAQGGENVLSLASRCTNLNSLDVSQNRFNPDPRRRLDLLLDRNACVQRQRPLLVQPSQSCFGL